MRNLQIPKSLAWLPLILALSLTAAFAKPAEPASADVAAVPTLTPTDRQVALDKTIAELLSQHHYRQSKLDDRLSALVLTNYLDDLDFSRAYFLASDIAGFEKYRATLDDALKKGDLQPAYAVFNVYLRRLAERTARIQTLLQQDFRFDVNESLDVNRKDAPWAKSSAELDDFWRKRLKHEMLTLMLSGKERIAARELLA